MAYPLSERCAAYLRVRQDDPSGSGRTAQLMNLYHGSGNDVQQALLEGIDWAKMLADMLALTGYGAARVECLLATTVPYCRIGDEFQLATFGASIRNSPIPVSPSNFAGGDLDEGGLLALRHVRDGLSAGAPTSALAASGMPLSVKPMRKLGPRTCDAWSSARIAASRDPRVRI